MSKHGFGEVCQKDFCPVCSLGKVLPCDNCGKSMPAGIHAEEMFCLPCSNKFWEHKPMEGGDCEHTVILETGDKFFSEYLRRWQVPVACVDCRTAWDTDIE